MLYHPDVSMPPNRLPAGRFRVRATAHATHEAWRDGLRLPREIDTAGCRVFEVETGEDGRVRKLGLRTPHDPERDLCVVVATDGPVWRVITCWANHKDDNHVTLDKGRYA